jgi:FAD synthetase
MGKKEKLKQGMCFGVFDKLHPGHKSYINQAKDCVQKLIVVVAKDKNVLKIKGKLPFENERIRLHKVKTMSGADKAVLGRLEDKYYWLKKLNPDIIFLGYDQKADIDEIKKIFFGKIKRLKSFKPLIYKSSKILCSPELLKKREN